MNRLTNLTPSRTTVRHATLVGSRLTLILLVVFAFGACEDFLEEVPRDEFSSAQFFTEPSRAEAALNALYRDGAPAQYMNTGVFRGSQAMYSSYLTGFFDNEFKGQEPFVQFALNLDTDPINSDGFLSGLWSQMYRVINRANNIIVNAPSTPGLSQEDSDRIVGTARFFRAYAYFTLVEYFGDIPVSLEPYESLDDIFLTRQPAGSVYEIIIEDLEFAANDAGLSDQTMVSNSYRITSSVAEALLARANLTMSGFPVRADRYANAADAARGVINSGLYSLAENSVDGNGDFDAENSAYNKIRRQEAIEMEFIYPIEFAIGISTSGYPQWTYPASTTDAVRYGITQNGFEPRPALLAGYDSDRDLRIQEKQYWHSMLETDGEVRTFATAPYIWHDDEALFSTANSDLQVRAISYPEVLLTAAEAIARSEGVTDEAVGYLIDVRERAYWQDDRDDLEDEVSGLSTEEFVEEVWRERYRELVFDCRLWFDMLRTRTFPSTSEGGNIDFVPLVGQMNTFGQTFAERHLLSPLPQTEVQRNEMLTQNPGYPGE